MNMQMNMNPNMIGLNTNQMAYYGQPQTTIKQMPNVDNILFVADLQDEACEEDLANFFKQYNFSFAKVFHNVMRTSAFVTFNAVEDAERARRELNGVKLSPKYANNKVARPVRICKYETKGSLVDADRRNNLLVKNISKDVSAHAMWNMFRQYGDVRSCKLVVDYLGNSKGYGYVSFFRVEDSERAKNELDMKDVQGKVLKVHYLEHGRRTEKRKNNIYVKHIPKENFGDEDLRKLFEQFGEIKSAVVLRDNEGNLKGFGFVCFDKPEDAEQAYKQMNNKSIFENIPNLYVNFAMKKSERLEHLQRKREETFKNSQKMTVFAKIKDENAVQNEKDFENQIRFYLNTMFMKEYVPRNIKVRFETKNAFITMNSQRDSEEFARKFQDFSKENQTTLFFNLYKSKVERISANAYFKKYNNFNPEADMMNALGKQQRYKRYNEFGNQPTQTQEFPQPSFNQPGVPYQYVSYNNFDENKPTPTQRGFVNYNNFEESKPSQPQRGFANYNNFQNVQNVQQPTQPKIDPADDDAVGEYLYTFIEKIYPDQASKLTGMLMETDIGTRAKLIGYRQEELAKIIETAYGQLQNQ